MYIEPRGSLRLDPQPNLDIKIDKTFRLGTARSIGVALEGFNIVNDGAISDRTMRTNSSSVLQSARPGEPAAVQNLGSVQVLTVGLRPWRDRLTAPRTRWCEGPVSVEGFPRLP